MKCKNHKKIAIPSLRGAKVIEAAPLHISAIILLSFTSGFVACLCPMRSLTSLIDAHVAKACVVAPISDPMQNLNLRPWITLMTAINMLGATHPIVSSPTITLSALVASGYSRTFGIQLNLPRTFHEPEIYVFDDEDRERWGEIELYACKASLSEGSEPTDCYASNWINAQFRFVCVQTDATINNSTRR